MGNIGVHVTVSVTNQTFVGNSSSGNQQINHVGKKHSYLWFETFNVPFYSINFSHVLWLSIQYVHFIFIYDSHIMISVKNRNDNE